MDSTKLDQATTSLQGSPGRDRDPYDLPPERIPPVLSDEQVATVRTLKAFLKAVADVNRLAILGELSREGEMSVLDISARVLLSQPLTSWHLHILKRARLVAFRTVGRQRIYRLNRERLKEYRELFDQVLDL